MDFQDFLAMDPLGQIQSNINSPREVIDSIEMLCMILMAAPEVAQQIDPIQATQVLQDAMAKNATDGDVQLMCTRGIGSILEFVPKACSRVCEKNPLPNTFIGQLKTDKRTIKFQRFSADELAEETLRLLQRTCLEGQVAMQHVPGGFSTVSSAMLQALDHAYSPHVHSAVLKLLSALSYRIPPAEVGTAVIQRMSAMVQGTVLLMKTSGDAPPHFPTLKNAGECFLAYLRPTESEMLPAGENVLFYESLFTALEMLSALSSAEAKVHFDLVLLILALYTSACPVHNVPTFQRILITNAYGSQDLLLMTFQMAAGITSSDDFVRAFNNPIMFLPSQLARGGTEGQVVTQEQFKVPNALSTLLYLMTTVVDNNAKSATYAHLMTPQCQWYWEDDINNFNKYDEASNAKLEQMFRSIQAGKSPSPVSVGGKYQADIAQMKQSGGGQGRNIRRSSIPFTFVYDKDTPARLQKNVPYDKDACARVRDAFLPSLIAVSDGADPQCSEWASDVVEKCLVGAPQGMAPEMLRGLCTFLVHRNTTAPEYVKRIVNRLSKTVEYARVLAKVGLVDAAKQKTSDGSSGAVLAWVDKVDRGIREPALILELADLFEDSSLLTGSELLRNGIVPRVIKVLTASTELTQTFTATFQSRENSKSNFVGALKEAVSFIVDDVQGFDNAQWNAQDSSAALGKLLGVSIQVRLCQDPTAVPPPPPRPSAEDKSPAPDKKTPAKKKGGKAPPSPVGPLSVGTVMEATWKGGSRYYQGKIANVNPDGTYAIQFDDGDFEPNAQPATIRMVGSGSPTSPAPPPAPPALNCPNGHGLSSYTSPGWSCDVCGSPGGGGTSMACRTCNFDMCMTCVEKAGGGAPTPGSPPGLRAHSYSTFHDLASYLAKEKANEITMFVDNVGEVPRGMTLLSAQYLNSQLPMSPLLPLRKWLQLPPASATNAEATAKKRAPKPKKGEAEASPAPPPTAPPTAPEVDVPALFSQQLLVHVAGVGSKTCPCGSHNISPFRFAPTEPRMANIPTQIHETLNAISTVLNILVASDADAGGDAFTTRLMHQCLQRCIPVALFGRLAAPLWFNVFPPDLIQHILPASNRRALLHYLSGGAFKSVVQYLLKNGGLSRRGPVNVLKRDALGAPAPGAPTPPRISKAYTISREKLLTDGGDILSQHTGTCLNFEVQYTGEEGTGQGPTTEFFSVISHELQRNGLGMWRGCDPDQAEGYVSVTTDGLFPAPAPLLKKPLSDKFSLLGRLTGVALLEHKVLELSLNPVFFDLLRNWDLIVQYHEDPGTPSSRGVCPLLCLESVHSVDPEFFTSLQWVKSKLATKKDAAELEAAGLSFNLYGTDLCPDGENVNVCCDNAQEYIDTVTTHILYHTVKEHIAAVVNGIQDVIQLDFRLLRMLNREELAETLCGTTADITVEDFQFWIEATGGYTHTSREIGDLINVWKNDFTKEERMEFVFFCTGIRKLGPGGVRAMKKLTVRPWGSGPAGSMDKILPTARACGFIFYLPSYSSKGVLLERLRLALQNGKGFYLS
eukprot:PhF_6_TR13403/c0_g1_i1/m.21323/K10590/TRIP12; E3 ubiquitin-protein ligase TRIP12